MSVRRKVIYTNVREINKSNIREILNKALAIHRSNATRLKFLFDYEEGKQPLQRTKTYRKDIDIQCVDNVAHEVTQFHRGYEWGNPITLIQRGENDSGKIDEPLSIALLNEQYEIDGIKTKTQQLGRDVVIGNIGYTHVDVNMDYEDGDTYFNVNVLSPFTTFVIRSSYYLDRRVMMAVTFNIDDNPIEHFTCYTRESRFDLTLIGDEIYEEMNPLHRIPIVEWIGNYDGMGIWEHEISEMDNLNLMISDFSNNVEQNMQAVWFATDLEFETEIITLEDGTEKEVTKRPKNGEWAFGYTSQDGKTPNVKPLTIDYDYTSQLNNIINRRALILQKCYCPQRNDDSGGSTGIAMQSAAGWSSLDVVSESIQAIQESCKMEEVKLVLEAIKISPFVPVDSPLLQLSAKDVQPNVKRQRLSEMSTKVNSLATMIKHGIYGLHAIKTANIFPDPNQVWEDSKPLIEAYQKSIFNKQNVSSVDEASNADRMMQDRSDQENNSPLIG